MTLYADSAPRIYLDCDGVLADFSTHLLKLIGLPQTVEDVTQWDIFGMVEAWGGPQKQLEAHDLCRTGAFWLTQPVLPGAYEGVALFRQEGYRVKCVTSPYTDCPNWDHVRRLWLAREFAISSHDVIITKEKDDIRGAAFVDDKFEHVAQWARVGDPHRAFLFDAPYNRQPRSHDRSRDSSERFQLFSWDGRPGTFGPGDLIKTLRSS